MTQIYFQNLQYAQKIYEAYISSAFEDHTFRQVHACGEADHQTETKDDLDSGGYFFLPCCTVSYSL